MDRPIAPTEPKKPRKPNKDNIMPQKPSRFYLVSLSTLLITGAIAAGMTIYSVFFYMGKIELPIIWLLTSILYMISFFMMIELYSRRVVYERCRYCCKRY